MGGKSELKRAEKVKILGDPESKSKDTIYQAPCDGFVSGRSPDTLLAGYADDFTPPTTIRERVNADVSNVECCFTMQVKINQYWKAQETGAGSSVVNWTPLEIDNI